MRKSRQKPWPEEKVYCCACGTASLVTLVLVLSIWRYCSWPTLSGDYASAVAVAENMRCDEFYVVGEGETLQSIMEECGDPFLVENNPHIHDSDDVFPGLVIKVVPFNDGKLGKL